MGEGFQDWVPQRPTYGHSSWVLEEVLQGWGETIPWVAQVTVGTASRLVHGWHAQGFQARISVGNPGGRGALQLIVAGNSLAHRPRPRFPRISIRQLPTADLHQAFPLALKTVRAGLLMALRILLDVRGSSTRRFSSKLLLTTRAVNIPYGQKPIGLSWKPTGILLLTGNRLGNTDRNSSTGKVAFSWRLADKKIFLRLLSD